MRWGQYAVDIVIDVKTIMKSDEKNFLSATVFAGSGGEVIVIFTHTNATLH